MVITAKSYVGRRTRLYDAAGVQCNDAFELDTVAKTAKVFVRKEDGKLLTLPSPAPVSGTRFTLVTKTIDVTGWSYKFLGLISIRL